MNNTSSTTVNFDFTGKFLPPVFISVFIIGLVANGWGLKSLMQNWKKLKIVNVFVLNLGFADILYLLTLPFLVVYYVLKSKWIFGDVFCKITRLCFNLNLYGSIGFLTCISVYRYLAIVHPVRVMGRLTLTHSVVISVMVWLLNLNLWSRVLSKQSIQHQWCNGVYIAQQISRGLVCLNSALNPLIYLHGKEEIPARPRRLLRRARHMFRVFIVGLAANGWGLKSLLQNWNKLGDVNVFVLNLGFADILYLLTLPFLMVYYFMNSKWIFGDVFCKITRFCFNLNLYGSIGFLTCISVYRYLAIVHPMKCYGHFPEWGRLANAEGMILDISGMVLLSRVPRKPSNVHQNCDQSLPNLMGKL
ncbi:hypothetical protein Q8A73_013567 [Channa argus]|nr:hypothetical protein Q8A73_013567 [Channa argus]